MVSLKRISWVALAVLMSFGSFVSAQSVYDRGADWHLKYLRWSVEIRQYHQRLRQLDRDNGASQKHSFLTLSSSDREQITSLLTRGWDLSDEGIDLTNELVAAQTNWAPRDRRLAYAINAAYNAIGVANGVLADVFSLEGLSQSEVELRLSLFDAYNSISLIWLELFND